MNSKIQQLTETIYKEGLQKARDEETVILNEAREKAAAIEKEAYKEAEKIVHDAQHKARELKKQVDSEIKMTLNQAVSAMKQEITTLVTMNIVQPPVKELFSDKVYLQTLISTVVRGWMEKESFDLKVILPESERGKAGCIFQEQPCQRTEQGTGNFIFSEHEIRL
jgi:V/A-type H+/Na+-transporting ATPase subunit E